VSNRDILTPKQLEEVADLEERISKRIYQLNKDGNHYKKIYYIIKGETL